MAVQHIIHRFYARKYSVLKSVLTDAMTPSHIMKAVTSHCVKPVAIYLLYFSNGFDELDFFRVAQFGQTHNYLSFFSGSFSLSINNIYLYLHMIY